MKRIVTLTEAGRQLGARIEVALADADLWHKPEPFAARVQQAFQAGEALIMICAAGIVLRSIAPVIVSKRQDPPVIVLDEAGRFVVPLLSGHEGGANELARQLAELIGAQLVVTTANPYLQPVYCMGMGCERGCEFAELRQLLDECLARASIDAESVAALASIELKGDEAGLIELGAAIECPLQVFDPQQLEEEEPLLSMRSDYVYETVGVYGVAESAALHAARNLAGAEPELVLEKQKSKRATCAIARAFPRAEADE